MDEGKVCPRAFCVFDRLLRFSLSFSSTRSHGLLSLCIFLFQTQNRSSRTRSKKPRYFPSCFLAATGRTRREIPRERWKRKRRRRRNSGDHSRLHGRNRISKQGHRAIVPVTILTARDERRRVTRRRRRIISNRRRLK